MPKNEYQDDNFKQTMWWNGSKYTVLQSGGLRCNKCHHEIPPAEMFCLRCYRIEDKPKRVRYQPPKPDDPGGLFS